MLQIGARRAISPGMSTVAATTPKSLPDARQMRVRSRTDSLRVIDGRTREARRLKTITADLVAQLGGQAQISAAQRFLIERVSVDLVRLERLDFEAATGTFSEHDGRVAHALRNSMRLALRDLGLKSAAPAQTDAAGPPLDMAAVRERLLRLAATNPEAAKAALAALGEGKAA